MTRVDRQRAARALAGLYNAHRRYVRRRRWEYENERWNELVVAVLIEGARISPRLAREAAHTLGRLKLSEPGQLVKSDPSYRRLLSDVLTRLGLDSQTAAAAIDALAEVAQVVCRDWRGKPQVFLRNLGDEGVHRFSKSFGGDGLGENAVERIARLWLQNVASLPIWNAEDDHLRDFRREYGISESELDEISDELGINVAVLDDVLARHHRLMSYLSTSGLSDRHRRENEPVEAIKESADHAEHAVVIRPPEPTFDYSRWIGPASDNFIAEARRRGCTWSPKDVHTVYHAKLPGLRFVALSSVIRYERHDANQPADVWRPVKRFKTTRAGVKDAIHCLDHLLAG
jgi:hypothetical protein